MERRFLLALMLGLTIPLSGCAPSPTKALATTGATAAPRGMAPAEIPDSDAALVHLLSRITFGARPEELARARRLRGQAYLEEQLDPDRAGLSDLRAELGELRT